MGKHHFLEILERLDRRVLARALTSPATQQWCQRLQIRVQLGEHRNSLVNPPAQLRRVSAMHSVSSEWIRCGVRGALRSRARNHPPKKRTGIPTRISGK